ncbi:glycosyltransferase family 4 protein [Azospirillum sp. SYSU D00513]|uniref:glycosyltransferase family 4 protein n=1 Tax=Azospirillum sp. SYSU D00513 TaxID=2812561 RepID=UPI001A978732|nr:glycosyltransferase family 4 protein [Azospirillum sp. SYSU D00513]
MRIAVFDYSLTATSPAGSCHLLLLKELCDEHDFVVFSTNFDNPRPDRISFVRIPLPLRPLAVLFVAFHIVAPIIAGVYKWKTGEKFDCIQIVESNLLFSGVVYAHFCHGAFLADHWTKVRPSGIRRWARWLDHWLHAILEPWVFGRAKAIVAPSRGLAEELVRRHEWTRDKIRVLGNPIDVDHFGPPPDLDRQHLRRSMKIKPDQILLSFIALGHFERKGLGILIDAIGSLDNVNIKLIVVGGTDSMLVEWRRRVKEAHAEDAVEFVGMQDDVRPFLWSADAFVLPSSYEVFPLVGLQAAAARVPIIATAVYGLSDLMIDGKNSIIVESTKDSVSGALTRFANTPENERREMGIALGEAVTRYGVKRVAEEWRVLYKRLELK